MIVSELVRIRPMENRLRLSNSLRAQVITMETVLKNAPQSKNVGKKLWIAFGVSYLLTFTEIILTWSVLAWTVFSFRAGRLV